MIGVPRLDLCTALQRGPLLLDAAHGTRLVARGLNLAAADPCLWNLDRPEEVADLHRRDAAAGSDAVLTNTFGANRAWLARFGRSGNLAAINRAAVALARETVGPSRFVLGGLGPTATSDSSAFREQVEALARAGVEGLMLETHGAEAAVLGLRHLREMRVGLPILVGLFLTSPPPADLAARLLDLGATALGGNCQDGMAPALALAEALRPQSDAPLIAKPGGGLPNGPSWSPESFGEAVPALLAAGVRLFGGCCGTTADHLAGLRLALDHDSTRGPSQRPSDRL